MDTYESFITKITKREIDTLRSSANTYFKKSVDDAIIVLERVFVDKEQGFVVDHCDGEEIVNARQWLEYEFGLPPEFWLKMAAMIQQLKKVG